MEKNYWRNKKVIVTGSSGFVGSHLVKFLESEGSCVVRISRANERNTCDITNIDSLRGYFSGTDIVFHLAGDALVELGQKTPRDTMANTMLGALNVLELSREFNIQKIIVASTSQVYGASEKVFNESDAPRPTRPYETSKACVDLIAQAYADSYNLPVLIPRFSNIYGPGDLHFDRLIPKTIRSIYQGKNPIMWGGKARRAYLYIEDAIRAYDTLGRLRIEDIDNNRIYNVSSVSVYSVEEVMQKILYHMNSSLRIEKIENERQHEAMIQVMNSSKARKILQWEDTMSLDEGLIKTIAWYRKYFNKQYD